MGKNRTIPFGYMMQNGIITTNPAEVLAVLTIFSEYMAGKSLNSIAKNMGVPYSNNIVWNKNMIKRILENEKYLGTETYPQLISEEVFKAVNERKSAKATSLCIVPDDLQEIRSLTVCKECSKRLFRTKAELWDCRNNSCNPFLFKLTDEMLTGAVLNILNTVIANPALIETETNTYELKYCQRWCYPITCITRLIETFHDVKWYLVEENNIYVSKFYWDNGVKEDIMVIEYQYYDWLDENPIFGDSLDFSDDDVWYFLETLQEKWINWESTYNFARYLDVRADSVEHPFKNRP